jgi:hypothetical protein
MNIIEILNRLIRFFFVIAVMVIAGFSSVRAEKQDIPPRPKALIEKYCEIDSEVIKKSNRRLYTQTNLFIEEAIRLYSVKPSKRLVQVDNIKESFGTRDYTENVLLKIIDAEEVSKNVGEDLLQAVTANNISFMFSIFNQGMKVLTDNFSSIAKDAKLSAKIISLTNSADGDFIIQALPMSDQLCQHSISSYINDRTAKSLLITFVVSNKKNKTLDKTSRKSEIVSMALTDPGSKELVKVEMFVIASRESIESYVKEHKPEGNSDDERAQWLIDLIKSKQSE